MSCKCMLEPLCGACGKPIHRCREAIVEYRGKPHHVRCWMERLARDNGDPA